MLLMFRALCSSCAKCVYFFFLFLWRLQCWKVSLLLLCSGDLTVKGPVPCSALFLFNFLNTQLGVGGVRWDQDGLTPPLYPAAGGHGRASSPLLTGSVCLSQTIGCFYSFFFFFYSKKQTNKLLFTSVPTTSWEEPHKPNAATHAAIAITFSWGSFCFRCLNKSTKSVQADFPQHNLRFLLVFQLNDLHTHPPHPPSVFHPYLKHWSDLNIVWSLLTAR